MTRLREVVLAGALLSLLPGAVRAESQPTNVSTATITLDLTPPDPFSAFSADRMVALPDGTRFVLGSGASNSGFFQFLLKVNPNGTQVWASPVADPFTANVTGLAADTTGNAYIAYTDFSNFAEPHAKVIKFNAAGGQTASADLTTDTPGGDGFPFSEGVAVDSARGRVYASYSFFSNTQSQNTFAVAALDTDLQPVATRVYDPGFTSGLGVIPGGGITVDGLGDVWVLALQVAPTPVPAMLAVRFSPDVASASPLPFDSPSVEELGEAADPRGGIVAAGDRQSDGNLYLHRVTAGGFGGQFRFEGFDSLPAPMAVDPAGNLYVLGFDPSTFFPAVVKLNASNALAWDQPGPYLNLPDTFAPGAVAAASSTTFEVASIDFNTDPIPVVLLHYQTTASSVAGFALSISSGNNQAGTITKATQTPLTVKVTDALGTAVVGATVTFSTSAAPSGATGHGLSVISTTTASDGTAATVLTFGNHVGTYTVTATCAGCVPSFAIFTAAAELRLVISLSTGSIRPSGTETSPTEPRTTLLVTAAGVSVPNERVANYPVVLVSTPVAFSGGHEHDANRPTGSFEVPGNPSVFTTDTGMDGSFLLSYVSTATGGQELITANSAMDSQVRTTTRTVIVEVPGLVLLSTSAFYTKVGGTNFHLGPPASLADTNHFGTADFNAIISSVSAQFKANFPNRIVRINDMSLPSGGIFDIGPTESCFSDFPTNTKPCKVWSKPHAFHRRGTSCDYNLDVGLSLSLNTGAEKFLKKLFDNFTAVTVRQESDHWHVYLPGGGP